MLAKKIAVFSNEEEKIRDLTGVVPYALETELVKEGAISKVGKPWTDTVQVDNRLVTGQNPQSATTFAKTVVSQIEIMQKKKNIN